jgi:transaldolase
MNNPLKRLDELGQSVWYDYIRRDLTTGPLLKRYIEEDGLSGMTSNPTIFQKAIAESSLYDTDIKSLARTSKNAGDIFESLAVADVRGAADAFRSVYDRTGGDDGFVSIEVAPGLARDTQGTITEARRLWKSCEKPNVMVKIPGTAEGLPAIRQCLAEGININITLLFSVARYREVMEAYLAAMEERVGKGLPVDRIRSVASFFVSRVDTNADKKLDAIANDPGRSAAERDAARRLRGRLAIANARIAYEAFEEVFATPRWKALATAGAKPQRPLWASTSTKDPALPELYYVEALVAPSSVDTMPPETLEAYRDHGVPKVRIRDDAEVAHADVRALRDIGISLDDAAVELENEGVRKFADSFDSLMKAIGEKQRAMRVA